MTWADVKQQVEAAGVQDTDEVEYIDITPVWMADDHLTIERDEVTHIFVVYG